VPFLHLPLRNEKYNILVIEQSSPALRGKVVSALTSKGFKAAIAASSEQALSDIDELNPSLIILGEGLLIDSFDACYQLRQAIDVPILMVGAVHSQKVWTRVEEVGADFYLVKPFSYPELVARVKSLIRRYEQNKNNNKGNGDHEV